MMENKVILADGTELNAEAGYANRDLWIWMLDADDTANNIVYLVGLFSDPAKTSKIIYDGSGKIHQEWDGFIVLNTIRTDEDGHIHIRMRKE